MERAKVIPGMKVGVIEEYLYDKNVLYEDAGVIRSKFVGLIEKDMERHMISLRLFRYTKLPKVGDEVIGRIYNISGVYGYVKIFHVVGRKEFMDRQFHGIVYPHRKVINVRELYDVGDYVYAVISSTVNRAIHLSINKDIYGVIESRCSNCGGKYMMIGKNKVKCVKCGNIDKKKLSKFYGRAVAIWK